MVSLSLSSIQTCAPPPHRGGCRPQVGGLLEEGTRLLCWEQGALQHAESEIWSSGLWRNSGALIGQAEAAVEAILTTIKASLQQGDPVIVRRFGRWQVRTKRARVGRNPKTGTAAAIPARRVVRFVVSRTLKQAVAEVGSPAD